jgi:hypothetical protein
MPRPCRGLERSLSERHIRGMAGERHDMCESNTAALCKSKGKDTIYTLSGTAWQGNGMVCVNQTRPHCVNQMGKTQSKPLAERHGRGTAWYV